MCGHQSDLERGAPAVPFSPLAVNMRGTSLPFTLQITRRESSQAPSCVWFVYLVANIAFFKWVVISSPAAILYGHSIYNVAVAPVSRDIIPILITIATTRTRGCNVAKRHTVCFFLSKSRSMAVIWAVYRRLLRLPAGKTSRPVQRPRCPCVAPSRQFSRISAPCMVAVTRAEA